MFDVMRGYRFGYVWLYSTSDCLLSRVLYGGGAGLPPGELIQSRDFKTESRGEGDRSDSSSVCSGTTLSCRLVEVVV